MRPRVVIVVVPSASLQDWTALHVQQWMRENGLEAFVGAFTEASIDGVWLLAGVTDEVLLMFTTIIVDSPCG